MIPPDTQRVIAFLADRRSYPHRPAEVRQVQTHASWVFIAPPLVYKVKKPVDFGFLDFSTLEKRRMDCEDEVRLNRRLAAEIYLGVEAVVDTADGLRLGGEGRVLEWTVKMREMNADCFLSHRLRLGGVTTEMIDRVAEKLLRFYAAQTALPPPEQALACRRLDECVRGNFEAMRDIGGGAVSAPALAAIERYSIAFEHENRALLDSRSTQGWIRDCHGDLHCEHIHLTDDSVQIYDCIEFNETFRHIDVACDIAFLVMDLDFNGEPGLARHLVERCADLLRDDGLPALMDFYKCYRACVRGKVEALHSTGETVGPQERVESVRLAQRYFRLALRYALVGSTPCAVVFMGRIASGKSSLAAALGRETGWRVVSSDCVRKTLAGVPLHRRGTTDERANLYSDAMTRRVYEALFDEASAALSAGECIILDATFSKPEQREVFRPLVRWWIMAEADEQTTLSRLRARDDDNEVVSDARVEDHAALGSGFQPPDELPGGRCVRIQTCEDPEPTLAKLMAKLAEENGRRVIRP